MPEELGNRDDEQVAVRHADAPGGYIIENQHEEDRMRDIQVSQRGSEAASEEQTDKLRKTERPEQEAPIASSSSDPYVALRYPARCETQSRLGSVFCRSQVLLMTTISVLDAFYEKDGRKSRYIGEVLERHRGEDAGDLKKVNQMNWLRIGTRLNALERKIWKINPMILMDEKSWKNWESNQNVVMDEESVQNCVMDEEFVKNFVMDAKIDPKVVMDLSIFKIGGWNILQPSNRKLLENYR